MASSAQRTFLMEIPPFDPAYVGSPGSSCVHNTMATVSQKTTDATRAWFEAIRQIPLDPSLTITEKLAKLHYGANLKLIRQTGRSSVNDSFIKLMMPLVKALFKNAMGGSISDKEIETEIQANRPAIDAMFTSLPKERTAACLIPQILAEEFELRPSEWRPTQTFDVLAEELKDRGPMMCMGSFGETYYKIPSFELKDTVAGAKVWGWSPKAPRLENPSVLHAIIVVGVQEVGGKQRVLFRDPNFPDKVFILSYEKFSQFAHTIPDMQQIPEQFREAARQHQPYGFHAR